MILAVVTSAAAFIAGSPLAGSPSDSGDDPGTRHAKVSLVSEEGQLAAGGVSHLGLHFKLDPHWHTYWLGSNTQSSQLEFHIELPEGFVAEPLEWPAPKRLISDGDLLDHVYENEVTLILPVRVPETAKPGPAKIDATVKYMICHTTCVFEEASLTTTLPVVSKGAPAAASTSASLFKVARERLPKPLPSSGDQSPTLTRKDGSIKIYVPGARGLTFFPAADCLLIEDPIQSAHAEKSQLSLSVEPGADSAAPFRGVLEVRYADQRGTQWFAVEPASVKSPPN